MSDISTIGLFTNMINEKRMFIHILKKNMLKSNYEHFPYSSQELERQEQLVKDSCDELYKRLCAEAVKG
jgi:hypothetical protein